MFRLCFVLVLLARPVWGDPYRLGPGDVVLLGFAGQGEAVEMQVDADGQVRLPQLGGLALTGLSLDAAERVVEQAVAQAGLYVEPRVTLAMAAYAPVIVAGDVALPGRFAYQPGLTAAAALALAGGMGAQGLSPYDRARTEAELAARQDVLTAEIAATRARAARLQAGLDGTALTLPGAAPDLLAAERAILSAARQRSADLVAQWDSEIAALEAQQAILTRRITLQQEIAAAAAGDYATAAKLQARQLQTSSRLSDMMRRDAEARATLMELQSTKIEGARALADARRQKTQFLAGERYDRLTALQAARLAVQTKTAAQAGVRQARGLLRGVGLGMSGHLQRISPRPGRSGTVDPDATLWPGETLVVRAGISARGSGDG